MKIQEEQLKKSIITMLSDDYSMMIISSALNKAKSINELSKKCNIPINTAYRRARGLVAQGLLIVERTVITDNGVKFDLYRSSINYVKIEWMPPDDQQVEIKLVENAIGKFVKVWNSLRMP
jgi:predicted transcriptional regulator